MKRYILWTAFFVLAACGLARAQGTQTGTISGAVQSPDGLAFPGVSVSVKSPALQGVRTVTTDSNGSYIFKALAPGAYVVSFEVAGMQRLEKSAKLELGRAISVDATLQIGGITETVTVTETLPGIVETASGGANYRAAEIDTLPTGRTIQAIATLAPGLSTNTPNVGQLSISGGFSYENVFLVDGVDVNDNVFGTVNNLFIEDAIEEQAVITSGISAEYGRFGGGIINTITKRGGNQFQGSFRSNFTNSAWVMETPWEKQNSVTHADKTNKTFEATLGGPILKDRLWFFAAGRSEKSETAGSYPDLGAPVTTTIDNKRLIAKLTGTIAKNHTVTGTYIYNGTKQGTTSFSITSSSGTRSIDPRTFYHRELPNNLIGINYNGVLTSDLFVEAQFSRKKQQFKGAGGTNTNLQEGSPFFSRGTQGDIESGGLYNAPYWDATDPENRDNRQFAVALSHFLSTGKLGRHDIKLGYENFMTRRTGGNSQSPTNFVFDTDYVTDADGKPLLTNGRFQPMWAPGYSSFRENWIATRGATLDITTQSIYLNDSWQIVNRLSANLGARFEMVRSKSTGGINAIDTTTIVPRLAASYDVLGDEKIRLDASYARYAGKYNDTQVGSNTAVGNPSLLYAYYAGPEGVGMDFAPAYDEANWVTFYGSIPTVNVKFDKNLHSPTTDEVSFGASYALPRNGYLKAIYTHRKIGNLIEGFTDTTTGNSTATLGGLDVGPFDNVVYRNSNLGTRKYQGVTLIGFVRPYGRWSVNANYTLQLKNYGDFEGEASNQPGLDSGWGDYPEIFVESRNFPLGRLPVFQRHRVRAWASHDLDLGKAGVFTPTILYRYDSGQTQSLTASAPLSAIQVARTPASYTSVPVEQTLYFGERGSVDFKGAHILDLGLNYSVPVWKTLRPWFKLELRNAFNNDKLTSWNTTVTPDKTGPVDADGLPTNYVKGRFFGQGRANANYPDPREFRFALGFRF